MNVPNGRRLSQSLTAIRYDGSRGRTSVDAIAGDLVEAEDAEPEPVRRPDRSIVFDGMTPIDEAAEILDRRAMVEADDYTTIAGFVLWRLGHIPQVNESFEWEGWRFVVLEMDGHRIGTVVATRAAADEPQAAA